MKDRRFARAPVAVALLVLSACSDDGDDSVMTSSTHTTTDRSSRLLWDSCPDDQTSFSNEECATLTVPLDHDGRDLGTVELAVRRRLARQSQRIGTLVWIDGGPGYRGTLRVRDARYSLALTSRFDLVSWDPRGTWGDTLINCPEGRESLLAVDPTPDSGAEVDQNEAIVEQWAAPCRDSFARVLERVGTYESARDLDALREALGEDRISILSGSYGTRVAAVYATLFPDRVRAAVLDGYDDPNVSLIDHGLRLAAAFEEQLDALLSECAHDTGCPFHSDGDPFSALDRLLARVDTNPLPGRKPASVPVTEAVTRSVIRDYLYSEPQRQELLEALATAADGDGDGLSRLFDATVEDNERGGITPETNIGIRCADRAGFWDDISSADAADFASDLATVAPRMAPSFGPTPIEAASYDGDCALQPLEHSKLPTMIDAADAGPLMVIAATGDTATPHEAALAAVNDLDAARLVTIDADHHTTYFTAVDNPNDPKYACVLEALHAYLIDLDVPTRDLTCTG